MGARRAVGVNLHCAVQASMWHGDQGSHIEKADARALTVV
jgi:hypothetical protein